MKSYKLKEDVIKETNEELETSCNNISSQNEESEK